MKVLLIGSGGREHALAWKFSQSPLLGKLFAWPGGVGISEYAESLGISAKATLTELVQAALDHRIDVVVCGPEAPLAEGLGDLCAQAQLPFFGPQQLAAGLESSKAFAKEIMLDAGIPTARFQIAKNRAELQQIATQMLDRDGATVLKASGLAAGKGVFVCRRPEDVEAACEHLYGPAMAKASEKVVVEEMLLGRECSYFCLLSSDKMFRLGFAVDHKRLKPGDLGPNTGGMGAYTPVPWLPADAADVVEEKIVKPLLQSLKRKHIPYVGWLYVGIMWSDAGPCVVEFNVRLGDPEAQVLAVSDSSDWLMEIASCLHLPSMKDRPLLPRKPLRPAVGFVVASPGYPFASDDLEHVRLPRALWHPETPDVHAFLASCAMPTPGALQPGSGRIMCVVARGEDFAKARSAAKQHMEKMKQVWPDFQWRHDIGAQVETAGNLAKATRERPYIILGSSSPRRKDLLAQLGLDLQIVPPGTDENPLPGEKPHDYVKRNVRQKYQAVVQRLPKLGLANEEVDLLVICADTIVVIDEKILEKPGNELHARHMLETLSGRTHEVVTAVSLGLVGKSKKTKYFTVTTQVTMKELADEEISAYIATGEPFDKAGSYAAQGIGSYMIRSIAGSYSNVVGLPLTELVESLEQDFGFTLLR